MGYLTLFLTLASAFCLAACAPQPPPNAEEEGRSHVSLLPKPDQTRRNDDVSNPEKAKEQLQKILSLPDQEKQNLLQKWFKLYKNEGETNSNSLSTSQRSGHREKYIKETEYVYQIPSHKSNLKYSRRIKHFSKPKPQLFLPGHLPQSGKKHFSNYLGHDFRQDISPATFLIQNASVLPQDPGLADTVDDDEKDEEDSVSADSEDVDTNEEDDLDDDEEPLEEDADKNEELDSEDLTEDKMEEDSEDPPEPSPYRSDELPANVPAETSAEPFSVNVGRKSSSLRGKSGLPDWLTQNEDGLNLEEDQSDLGQLLDSEYPTAVGELDLTLESSKHKKRDQSYLEVWNLLHPDCHSLSCVPVELRPGFVTESVSVEASHSSSCQRLAKVLIKLWKKLSVYLGTAGQEVPQTLDLKRIFFLINLYLKLNQQHNLSQQPIKVIISLMYKILKRYPSLEEGFPDFLRSNDDDPGSTSVDLEVDIEHHEDHYPEHDHSQPELEFTKEQLLKILVEYYKHDKKIPDTILKLIIRDLLLEIVPDFNKLLRSKCERKAFLKLFKSVTYALRAYLNKEDCRPLTPTPLPDIWSDVKPDLSDILDSLGKTKPKADLQDVLDSLGKPQPNPDTSAQDILESLGKPKPHSDPSDILDALSKPKLASDLSDILSSQGKSKHTHFSLEE